MGRQKSINISNSGAFSKINIDSVDNSVTNIVGNNQLEIFDKILKQIQESDSTNKPLLIDATNDLKNAIANQDTISVGTKFARFVELAASAGTVLLEHVPQITQLVQGLLA